MKYIFDFDGVLFDDRKQFRENIFLTLEKVSISRELATTYLEKERWNLFSLKKMLAHFSTKEDLYEEIMEEGKNLANRELLKTVKKIGKENCFMVSYGDKKFQLDKIKRTGIAPLFSEIIIVSDSKKGAIEKICTQHPNEEIFFIDDKAKHFEDLDFKKCSNLKTVLFTNNVLLRDVLPVPSRRK